MVRSDSNMWRLMTIFMIIKDLHQHLLKNNNFATTHTDKGDDVKCLDTHTRTYLQVLNLFCSLTLRRELSLFRHLALCTTYCLQPWKHLVLNKSHNSFTTDTLILHYQHKHYYYTLFI